MPDYTPHQKKIISRYYDHQQTIMLQKLSELVSELYLADSEAKRGRLWRRAEAAMKNLKVPESLIAHILAAGKPELLARHIKEWIAAAPK